MPQLEGTKEQRKINDQLPYVNEIMVAIRQINDAILQYKDPVDATKNLITDLPIEWQDELKTKLSQIDGEYNLIHKMNNRFIQPGYSQTQKDNAKRNIYLAGKTYAWKVKTIVISLLNDKKLLFKTQKEIEHGSLSLWKGGDIDD